MAQGKKSLTVASSHSCTSSKIVSFYCFMPTEMTNHFEEGFVFAEVPVSDLLVGKYDTLDPQCVDLIKHSIDRMPWRLYEHQPYSVSLC
jgi:salicylate hydroxylase